MKIDVKGALGTIALVGGTIGIIARKYGQEDLANHVESCTQISPENIPIVVANCKAAANDVVVAGKSAIDYFLASLTALGGMLNLFGQVKKK